MHLEVQKLGFHGKLLINHLTFSHNKADYGGGIYAFLKGSGNVALIVSNCDFFNGTALNGSGGGMYIEGNIMQSANILLKDLKFSHNKADYGGSIYAYLTGSGNVALIVSNCDFFNGTALYGGGMRIEGNMIQSANILLNDLRFSHNKADYGGGIYAYLTGSGNVALIVSNCDFFNGTALSGSGVH